MADNIAIAFPDATDEDIYQLARRIVGAEIQKITYEEFLPILLGPLAPNPEAYAYDNAVDTRIANEFSTAAFRFGHSMVSQSFKLCDNAGCPEEIFLKDAFFASFAFKNDVSLVDELIGGHIHHEAQKLDHMLNDIIRNFLFGDK